MSVTPRVVLTGNHSADEKAEQKVALTAHWKAESKVLMTAAWMDEPKAVWLAEN